MAELEKKTPTSLVQTYYSCVLAPVPALIDAFGIGVSAGSFFVFLGFLGFCLLMVLGLGVPLKGKLDKEVAEQQLAREKELHEVVSLVLALKKDMLAGATTLPSVQEVARNIDEGGQARESDLLSPPCKIDDPMLEVNEGDYGNEGSALEGDGMI
mmetsp:Transcript_3267/g.7540  ORF Transcript_3267/g.7540 Transcript_3267/m.7540 type:complete len:155 (+) Transcript_3267:424-888(+)